MSTLIDSDYILPDTEHHFKVLAGPGAGKTRFLVNHIKNILNNSKRLKIQGKIACITYTNVATETILKRLGDHGGRLEISTIHSFLYKHVVKPYINLIAPIYGLDAKKIDGHDDVLLTSYPVLSEWKTTTKQTYLGDEDIIKAWKKLRWKFDPANDTLILRPPYVMTSNGYNFRGDSYLEYKKILWREGILHHDDVLFFSYELIRLRPFILTVLQAKFPYFLVDEFQDTSPIQITLLKLIAQKETMVGVVGDEVQSIYKFLGAVPGQLDAFTLPSICTYQINDNWRSSKEIVDLLNKLRPNLTQQALRNVSTNPVKLLVGEKLAALNWVTSRHEGIDVFALCRENGTANALKKGLGISIHSDLLEDLKNTDKTSDRRRAVSNSVKAVEYARLGYFKDALKTLGKIFDRNKTLENKKLTLAALKKLLDGYNTFANGNLIDLVSFIRTHIKPTIANLRTGAVQTFYNSTPYSHLSVAVKNLYESGSCKTIHKAKGDEFECVLIILEAKGRAAFNESTALSFLLSPDLSENEEHRVNYVAVSRAKDNLYITTPTLSTVNEVSLTAIGVQVVRL